MSIVQSVRAPVLPFTLATATEKVQLAENGWNSKDPAKVASAYTVAENQGNGA